MTTDNFLTEIPIIETKHYLLRGVTLDDIPCLFSFMSERETMKYITPHPVKSKAELHENMAQSLNNFKHGKEIPWVIIDKNRGEIVGFFRFHKLNLWHKKTEMGVVIRKDAQNSGVMTEVLAAILPFGFNRLRLNRIVGDIFAENIASEKLLMKFGFKKEGQLRQTDFDGIRYHDTVVFSLLKSEFQQNQTWK